MSLLQPVTQAAGVNRMYTASACAEGESPMRRLAPQPACSAGPSAGSSGGCAQTDQAAAESRCARRVQGRTIPGSVLSASTVLIQRRSVFILHLLAATCGHSILVPCHPSR